MKFIINLLFLILLSVGSAFAIAVDKINPTDYVTDYTNTLSQEQVLELSKKLGELERVKNIPVAVVMVPTMEDEFGREDYIEHYAVKLFEKLRIGNEKTDEGLLWLIVKDKREMRMEVGYGLEPVLTDGLTKIIQDNFVRPEFKQDKYFEGIDLGIGKITQVLNEEETSLAKGFDEDLTKGDLNGIIVFMFIVFINLFGRKKPTIRTRKFNFLSQYKTFEVIIIMIAGIEESKNRQNQYICMSFFIFLIYIGNQ